NAAYVDGVYTEWPQGPGFQKGTGLYSGDLNLTGDEIVYSPRWSGTAGLDQTIHALGGTFDVAADEYFNSGFYTDAYNTVKQGAFAVL
ncbi:hypothetical protein, partial [Staphylococcus aureus]